MKNFLAWSALVLACAGVGHGQGSVKAVGVAVVWEDVKERFGGSSVVNQHRPVTLAIVAETGGAKVISLNEEKSSLELLRDDTGKDLAGELWAFPDIAEDGTALMLDLHGEKAPDKRAEMIQAKGTLTLVTGEKTETKKSAPVPLQKGQKIEVGDKLTFRISKAGKPDWGDDPLGVSLEIDRDIPEVAEVVFYDGQGEVIESSRSGSSRMGFFSKVTVEQSYNLKRKVDTIQVEMKLWTDLAEVEVPFNVSVALGGAR